MTEAEDALKRNLADGTDVALSLALQETLARLGELQNELGALRRRLVALESASSAPNRASEPTRA